MWALVSEVVRKLENPTIVHFSFVLCRKQKPFQAICICKWRKSAEAQWSRRKEGCVMGLHSSHGELSLLGAVVH